MSVCRVEGCTSPTRRVRAELCEMHYYRLRRTGTTDLIDRDETIGQTAARFERLIDKSGSCWIYTGTISAGYGQFVAQGKRFVASRFAYQLWVGPIPTGYQVDHVWAWGCRDTRCVNPAHLEAVTSAENLMRSNAPSAVNKRKSHCIHGHEFTVENTGRDTRGDRYCRECRRGYSRAYRARAASR